MTDGQTQTNLNGNFPTNPNGTPATNPNGTPRSRSVPGRGRGGASSNGGRGRGSAAYANRVCVPNLDVTEHANHVVTDRDREGLTLTEDQWRTIKRVLNAGKDEPTEKLTGPHFEDCDWDGY